MVRGPGEGLTVTVSLTGVYKTGGLDLPSPPTDTSLKFYVPCKQCPPMKKGNGDVGKCRGGLSLMKMMEAVESEGLGRGGTSIRSQLHKLSIPSSSSLGISYLLMGQVEENRGPILPPESFVVLYRPTQHQILTNLSKRCPSKPAQAAGSQA